MTNYDKKYESTDKYSLRGRVFQRLREDILSGKYKEHEELKEVAIGEELGVSRTPVREAFRQLELEGLIRIVPNKGAYVTGITAKDVKDIYMIRSLLEGEHGAGPGQGRHQHLGDGHRKSLYHQRPPRAGDHHHVPRGDGGEHLSRRFPRGEGTFRPDRGAGQPFSRYPV